MHRRTLHRHLRIEGLAFRRVADEVRFEIACELLANTDMALSQIAAALKYSESSAFTRAFRRWSGRQTPSAWRASHPRVRKSRRPRRPHHPRPGPDAGGPQAGRATFTDPVIPQAEEASHASPSGRGRPLPCSDHPG
ncbi:helix-turn-helix transcriptional regulator [Microvirga sp. 2TAF3]|uniref:helix-turn-helix transcriptional regulator n=1 Tax=Microvirga sp. 2TAF3 TaxID=3233014 RepID=UPI003F9DCA06